ncbi:hypothetical protein [Endozoicomonas euniceicola]|uniref:Uncharacterized protein n=1 Tax=Endozoicomonas euniceicola TaxID=1234143 RepID=A0ABY6H062_9GAMM|nr:hypothetical protein [Endozoicomonas euniceicola]UYM18434.1 hypothetical protein NX720_11200 [Endozoicomonas euniceicola]
MLIIFWCSYAFSIDTTDYLEVYVIEGKHHMDRHFVALKPEECGVEQWYIGDEHFLYRKIFNVQLGRSHSNQNVWSSPFCDQPISFMDSEGKTHHCTIVICHKHTDRHRLEPRQPPCSLDDYAPE